MICERLKEQIPVYLAGELDRAASERFLGHLDLCVECRAEVARLDTVWRAMDTLPVAEPCHEMRPRFQEMLAAYQLGLASQTIPQKGSRFTFAVPAWAAVACAGLVLMLGVTAGRESRSGDTSVAQLKTEMEGMRRLVTLSLLQQQSPGARLRGVNYSYQMEKPDPQVEAALIYAVNHDANVNVRLSAVDALQKVAATPAISRALIDALPVQDSPLVQIALIDLLAQRNETDAAPVLRKLSQDQSANAAVRQRAKWGLNKLGVA